MSTLPKQIQRQLDEIKTIEAQDAAPATPPVEPEAPKAPEPEAPAPATKAEDWEQKYRTLQGMVEADKAERDTQRSQIAVLTAKLEAITATPSPAPAAAKQPAEPLITAKDTEDFGPEMIDVIQRAAKQVAAEEQAKLLDQIEFLQAANKELEAKLGGVSDQQGQDKRRTYFADLKQLVPDYEAINLDPGFIDWLKEADALSEVPRQIFLNAAFERFDVKKTAALFTMWRGENRPATPAETPAAAPNPLERQVAPNSSRTTDAPASDAAPTKVWTQAEVAAFYKDCRKGKYARNKAEQVRIETEIDAAAAQGRVR